LIRFIFDPARSQPLVQSSAERGQPTIAAHRGRNAAGCLWHVRDLWADAL